MRIFGLVGRPGCYLVDNEHSLFVHEIPHAVGKVKMLLEMKRQEMKSSRFSPFIRAVSASHSCTHFASYA